MKTLFLSLPAANIILSNANPGGQSISLFQLEHFSHGLSRLEELFLGDFPVCVEVTLAEATLDSGVDLGVAGRLPLQLVLALGDPEKRVQVENHQN